MPLIHSKKKSAMGKNIKTEMEHGKPQKQAVAIAYSVMRRARGKKASGGTVRSGSPDMDMSSGGTVRSGSSTMDMAEGGEIKGVHKPSKLQGRDEKYPGKSQASFQKPSLEKHIHKEVLRDLRSMPKPKLQGLAEGGMIRDEQASTEARPAPEQRARDAMEVSRNSRDAAPRKGDSFKTGEDISYQSKYGPKTTAIKHPKMVPQSVYSTRLRDEEDDLQRSASPASPETKASQELLEKDTTKMGSDPDMAKEHSTKRKPYAKGGEVEAHDYEARPNRYMDDLQDLDPSEDEGAMMAHMDNEEGPDRQGPQVPDMEDQHNSGRKPYARGGHIQFDDAMDRANEDMGAHFSEHEDLHHEMDEQPEDEYDTAHDASVASAVMARRKRMARGGEILQDSKEPLSHESIYTHEDADQADLTRNAEEDANEEDQLSFNALRKENYSESAALMDQPEDFNETSPEHDEEDVNDRSMVSRIRSRMKAKSAITRGGEGR